MHPEAQRIAIAEACGWRFTHLDNGWHEVFDPTGMIRDSSKPLSLFHVPDYLNDLNAMHEAEKTLSRWEDRSIYIIEICRSIDRGTERKTDHNFAIVNLTAAQRAEAFLRTLVLWKE